MKYIRLPFLVFLAMMFCGSSSMGSEPDSPSVLVDMFDWWNGIINSDEPLTAEQFRQFFTEDAVIMVNNKEQVRGVEQMPAHFKAIRERPGTIEIELPFLEEFQSGNKIFTYHRIRSVGEQGVSITRNMGYATLEGDRIASVSLARFQEQ